MTSSDRALITQRIEEELCKIFHSIVGDLLLEGEEITFEIKIRRGLLVTVEADSNIAPQKVPLPKDQRSDMGIHGSYVTSYSLAEKDWSTLLSLPWAEQHRKILVWLCENNNGPIASSQFFEICGAEWTRSMSVSISCLARKARIPRELSYHWQKIAKRGPYKYYAFQKTTWIS